MSITVDTLVDEFDGSIHDRDVSLRDAIAAARVGETIIFNSSLDGGTISLAQALGELVINKSLTIDATGLSNGMTIDAGNGADHTFGTGDGFRIFNIDDGNLMADKTVSIAGLTLTGGDLSNYSGGAIVNMEDLAVIACTISNNSATDSGGVLNYEGNLSVTDSTINGNSASDSGGGVFNYLGNLTVTASIISGNSAGDSGGGILSSAGNLTVTASTISDNSADYGGGIWSGTNSDFVTTRTQIFNTTISANQAFVRGGGIYNVNGLTEIWFSTITENSAQVDWGSGVASYGDAQTRTDAYSNIIAGNLGSDVDFVEDLINTFDSSGFNLIGTGNATGAFGATGDQVIGSRDPGLGPLADNGGPTWTHSLLVGSPAIDTGNRFDVPGVDNVPLFDQRGNPFTRKFDGDGSGNARLDVGAYELQHFGGPMTYVVDTPADETDGDYSAGDLSLREAIGLANGNVGFADTIAFDASLNYQTITLQLGELRILDDVSISGPGAELLTVDASGNDPTPFDGDGSRVFLIDDGNLIADQTVSIAGLTLAGGDVYSGGAILNSEDLAVVGCTIRNNLADSRGGGISNEGNLTVTASAISNNAAFFGGGIYNIGTLTVTDSVIDSNYAAAGFGGGICSTGGTLTVTDTLISNNVATQGGGIYNDVGSLTVTSSTIDDNHAMNGGGIYNYQGMLTLTSSTISNSTAYEGAGIINVGNLIVSASTINNNVAAYGGGISSYTDSDFVTTQTQIFNSTISANQAYVLGGGIHNNSGLTVIQFSTITDNQAPDDWGSGVASVGLASVLTAVHSSIIAGNLGSDVDSVNGGSNSFDSSGVNVIGTGNATGAFGASGDQVIDPDDLLVGPLADNGGPTWTHALLPGGPAIDAGDPGYVYNPNDYDQRGAPFTRVADGDGAGGARIDVGAFEVQVPLPPLLLGDYNQNNVVDAADYTVWRNNLGANVALPNEDPDQTPGWVTAEDYVVWKAHFGQTVPPPGAGSAAAAFIFTEPIREVGKVAVPVPAETTTASVQARADTARGAGFAMLEARSARRDSGSRPPERINIFRVAKSAGDKLLLTLAIDRAERSSWQDFSVASDHRSDDHPDDDLHSQSLNDEPLAMVLAEWR